MMNLYSYHNSTELDNYDVYFDLLSTFDIGTLSDIGTGSHSRNIFAKIEHIIKKNPYDAYSYAYWVLVKRWPEAEPYIMKSSNAATMYAIHVMKGQWVEAEPVISKSNRWNEYRYICKIYFNVDVGWNDV